MIIEVLHIDDCPSWVEAGNRLREALDTTGFGDAKINYRVLRTTDEVAGVPFAGSPTILLDGEDLFPGIARTSDLACRVYATERGLAGMPSNSQFIEALAPMDGDALVECSCCGRSLPEEKSTH